MVAWTLVFHIMGLVFWLGSLLVVTHTLAIHTEEASPEARAALGRLESKLLRGLAHPGAAIMVITGFMLLAHDPNLLRQHWMHAKLLLVVVLIALDLRVTFRARAFQEGTALMTRGECMALHGGIALVFTLILILVFVKPFGPHHVKSGKLEKPAAAGALWATNEFRRGWAGLALPLHFFRGRGIEEWGHGEPSPYETSLVTAPPRCVRPL